MQVYSTEESLDGELLEGEELLWSGRPRPGGKSTLSPARGLFIAGCILLPIGLVITILGALVLATLFNTDSAGASMALFIPGGILLIEGMIFFLVGLFGRLSVEKESYAITDRRVLIIRRDRHLHVNSYTSSAITHIHRVEQSDGSGDLIFYGNPSSHNTHRSGNQVYRTSRPGVFVAIPNVRQVEQKLMRMLDRR